jgi:hypothetical protein
MKLMLLVIFACVGFGLLSRRFGGREHLAVAALAVAMTGLYYFTTRFMT